MYRLRDLAAIARAHGLAGDAPLYVAGPGGLFLYAVVNVHAQRGCAILDAVYTGPAFRTEEQTMPATSDKQKRFMQAEYGRAKAGQKTKTGMSKAQLRDYADAPVKPKPKR